MSNAEASATVINGAATIERLHYVYGTLMSPEVLTELIGRIPPLIPGKLKGYKRYRVPNQVYPGILPDEEEGSVVDGLLVQDMNEKDIAVFDAFEGDDYVKTPVEVEVDDGDGRRHMVAAYVYVWIPVPGRPLVEPWSYEESFRPNLAEYLIMSKEFRDSLVHLPR